MKYDFNTVVDRHGTFCTQWDYTEDRFGSDDVLPFSISDMDFPLPPECITYLQAELISGIYGYTRWRNPLLLDSIVDWYKRRFDLDISLESIMYSPTVIYSLSEIIRMKTSTGDGVLLLTPAYDAFFNVIKENKCNLITSELMRENGRYYIDFEDFESKLSTSKVLLMCSPHNPVGKFWDSDELKLIIKLCKKNNVYIISDEIHMDVSFGKKHIPILEVAREVEYQNNVCIITSATKAFNFPGLLFSYAIFENELDRIGFERALKNKNGLSSCTILGMKATAYVYNNLEEWLTELNQYVYSNYQYLINFIDEHELMLDVTNQDGTYLIWIDASYYDVNKLLRIMYTQTKVGIMSGEVYGVHGYLRINIGCQRSKLELGLNRLKQAIEIYKEEE